MHSLIALPAETDSIAKKVWDNMNYFLSRSPFIVFPACGGPSIVSLIPGTIHGVISGHVGCKLGDGTRIWAGNHRPPDSRRRRFRLLFGRRAGESAVARPKNGSGAKRRHLIRLT